MKLYFKKDKKGALEPDKYLVGFAIFSLVAITFVLVMMSFNENYSDVDIDHSAFTSAFNLSDELYNNSEGIRDATLGKEISETDTPDSMFAGAFAAVRFLRDSFRFVGNIADAIFNVIPIPSVFKVFLMTIVSIMVIFALVYLVFRFQTRS